MRGRTACACLCCTNFQQTHTSRARAHTSHTCAVGGFFIGRSSGGLWAEFARVCLCVCVQTRMSVVVYDHCVAQILLSSSTHTHTVNTNPACARDAPIRVEWLIPLSGKLLYVGARAYLHFVYIKHINTRVCTEFSRGTLANRASWAKLTSRQAHTHTHTSI